MKLHALVATAALSFCATATAAYADADLFIVGLAGPGSFTFSGPSDGSYSTLNFEGLASGAYNLTPELGLQGDLLINAFSVDFEDYTTDKTSINGALHLFYRDSDRFLLGGFVQLGSSTYKSDGDETQNWVHAYAGAEGQLFIDDLTLYGQLGATSYSTDINSIDGGLGWFGTLEARYFLTPDFKIAATAGFLQVDLTNYSVDSTATTVRLGASAEYKLPELPISLLAKLDYAKSSNNLSDNDIAQTRVMFGIKFAIGDDTLRDRDRGGASLKPVEPSELVYPSVL